MEYGCTALIVAAGSASRMQGIDKILEPLEGLPLIQRTVRAVTAASEITRVVIATSRQRMEQIHALCPEAELVEGGATRAHSVLNGLRRVTTQLVAIHDGARPLVTVPVIQAAVEAAREMGAAAPAIPVHDTVKVVRDGLVVSTPDRSTLYAVQTPQVFSTELILRALREVIGTDAPLTDDCSAVEWMGHPVRLTPGSQENLKVTTPMDLLLAEAILKRRETV